MRAKIKVSVIITVYNIERYIEECIDSVLNQGINAIEIICVDDASTDNSGKVLTKYAQRDERIRIVHNKTNQGQATSRNRGGRLARGEYLYFMDGDDCLNTGALKKLYEYSKKERLDLITFSAETFTDDPDLEVLSSQSQNLYKRSHKYEKTLQGVELFVELVENNDTYGSLCLQFIDRKFFVENKLYGIEGLRYNEDDPFPIYLKAKKAKCIPDILYRRRIRKGSVTMSQQEVCRLESSIIQYVHNLQVWQSCSFTVENNLKIEKFFLSRHMYILSLERKAACTIEEMPLLGKYPMAKYIFHYCMKRATIICKNLTKKTVNSFSKYKHVIVYGAGIVASEATEILEKNGIHDYWIAVSEIRNEEKEFKKHRVYSIDELKDFRYDSVVVIATMPQYYKDINEKLRSLGFKDVVYVN